MEENKKELNVEQMEKIVGGDGWTYPPNYCPTHKEETIYSMTIITGVPGQGPCYVAIYVCPYCDYKYRKVVGPAPNPWAK